MKFSWKGLGLFSMIAILIGLNVAGVFYFTANFFDWKIDFLNINPSDKTTSVATPYEYPFSGAVIQENGTITTDALFSIAIEYGYNGTLAEGTPFYLSSFGLIFPKGQQVISHIYIGYRGSSHYLFLGTIDYTPLFEVSLMPQNTYGYPFVRQPKFNSSNSLVIKWDTQGDYYPYLQISFKNGSGLVDLDIPICKVHVSGLNEIQMQDYTRVGTAAAITALVLTIIDIIYIKGLYPRLNPKQRTRRTRRTTRH